MAIVYRLVKNSELTWVELDGNFSFLDDKIDQVAAQTGSTEIVRVTPQVFLPAEEDQARANIKAASVDQVFDLNDRVDFLETYNPVMYTPQILLPTEQQTARENIKAAFADDVAALQGLQFESDQANATLTIKDGNGLVLTTISLMYLNNEGTKFIYNPTTQELELWNDQGDLLSSVPVSAFVSNLVSNANWNGTTPSRLDFKDNTGVVLFSIDYSMSNINGLVTALAGKANTDGGNITNVAQWKTNLGINDRFEKESVESLLDANTHKLGLFTVISTTLNLPENSYGVIYAYKADATWWFQQFKTTNGTIWERIAVNPSDANSWEPWIQTNANSSISNYALRDGSNITNIAQWKTNLGINDINWNQAYNERVVQFNTTYTTSVYTFSLLLGNGTTKSTNLQVSASHFTIGTNGVLQLNNTIAQKINDSATQTYVDNKVASIPPQRRYNLNDTNNNDFIENIAKLDSFPISGLEVVVFNALTSQFESPLVGSDFKDSFMSICGLLVDDDVIIKGLVNTTSNLTSLINSGKFHLCMAYVNTGSIYTGTIEWMSSQDIYGHRKGTTTNEIKDIIKIADIVSLNSVFVNPKNI